MARLGYPVKFKNNFLMKRFFIALQFLTILPVAKDMTVNEADIVKSSSVFVLVGLIQGILLIAVDYAAVRIFQHDLVIGILLLVLVLSNGGFHLDGLADTFDATAAKGDKQKKLSVMKDGSIGPVGVIALFFALLLKFLALKNLSSFSLFTFCSSLILMPAFSKWAMVTSMFHGKPARENGLGKIFIGKIGFIEMVVSTLILLLSCVTLQVFFDHSLSFARYIFYAISAIFIYLLCRISVKFFSRQFGGLTGDTLGAISEITEIIFLFMVIAWSRFSI